MADETIGIALGLLGIALGAVVIYCVADETIGWWGLLFLLPVLLVLALAIDAPRR